MSGERVGGHNKKRLRAENKQKRVHRQLAQDKPSYWTLQEGNFKEPTAVAELDDYIGEMCPKGLALHHPAAAKLLQYATGGCPVNSGQPWTTEMIEAAIARGPHVSALVPEAIMQLEWHTSPAKNLSHSNDPTQVLQVSGNLGSVLCNSFTERSTGVECK
jgi:hypothetical protein